MGPEWDDINTKRSWLVSAVWFYSFALLQMLIMFNMIIGQCIAGARSVDGSTGALVVQPDAEESVWAALTPASLLYCRRHPVRRLRGRAEGSQRDDHPDQRAGALACAKLRHLALHEQVRRFAITMQGFPCRAFRVCTAFAGVIRPRWRRGKCSPTRWTLRCGPVLLHGRPSLAAHALLIVRKPRRNERRIVPPCCTSPTTSHGATCAGTPGDQGAGGQKRRVRPETAHLRA